MLVELTKTADGIDVRGKLLRGGDVTLSFVSRRPGALVNTYKGETREATPRHVELIVESASESGLVVSMNVDGEAVASHVEAPAGTWIYTGTYSVKSGSPCPFTLDFGGEGGNVDGSGIKFNSYVTLGSEGSSSSTCGGFEALDRTFLHIP